MIIIDTAAFEKEKEFIPFDNRDLASIQFSPHESTKNLIACGSTKNIFTYDIEGSSKHISNIVAHTRPILDLSWSLSDPHIIASCSLDQTIKIWDLRQISSQTVKEFKMNANGVTTVKWNR